VARPTLPITHLVQVWLTQSYKIMMFLRRSDFTSNFWLMLISHCFQNFNIRYEVTAKPTHKRRFFIFATILDPCYNSPFFFSDCKYLKLHLFLNISIWTKIIPGDLIIIKHRHSNNVKFENIIFQNYEIKNTFF